jgi:hypothetical protein
MGFGISDVKLSASVSRELHRLGLLLFPGISCLRFKDFDTGRFDVMFESNPCDGLFFSRLPQTL